MKENSLCSWQHQDAYWPLLNAVSCRNDISKRFRSVVLLDVSSLIKASRVIHRKKYRDVRQRWIYNLHQKLLDSALLNMRIVMCLAQIC